MTQESVPPPPTAHPAPCPVCGTLFARPATDRCARCGADLTDPAVERIVDLDDRWRALAAEREQLVAHVAATRVPRVGDRRTPVATASSADSDSRAAPGAGGAAGGASAGQAVGIPTLLALGGAALLTTAAVVFTAVAWTTLPALAQAAILLAATALAAVGAVATARRRLPTAAGALGIVAMSFAAVCVAGLDRAGAATLDAFTWPLAAAVAAAVGWALARAGLRWVSTAGAAAVVVAGASLTVAAADVLELPVAAATATGVACGAAAAASAVIWAGRAARLTAVVGGGALLVASGLVAAAGLAEGETGLAAGAATVAIAVALLIAGARWADAALAPAVGLTTAGAVAVGAYLGAEGFGPSVIAATLVATAAWGASVLPTPRRWWVLAGSAPAALVVAGIALWGLAAALGRVAATVGGTSWGLTDPWAAVTAALAGAALLALPQSRAAAGWVALPVLVAVSGALPLDVASPLLLVAASAAGAFDRALRCDPVAALATAAVAVGLAAGRAPTLAAAAAVTAALAGWLAGRAGAWRARTALGVALAAVGVTVAAVAHAAGAGIDVALGAGTAAALACAVAAARLGRDDPPYAGATVAGIATVTAPLAATSSRAAGVLLLVAAVGWVGLAVAGWRPARWVASGVVSAGSFVLLGDAEVTVVEAYTAVPAVALAAAGLWWLIEDRGVRTLAALSPALSIGLVPSIVTLAADPRVLPRTLGLAVAAGALAVTGVRGRWLAPTVAGGLTALGVAATQLRIVAEVVPRWATFAAIGLLLVWLAATYERQQQRRRALAERLAVYR